MKTVPTEFACEYVTQTRSSRVSRRSEIEGSIRTPPIIHSHTDSDPDEIIELLHSWIEPSVHPWEGIDDSNSNNSVEIVYEELNPPDIYEVVDRFRTLPRTPETIVIEDSTDGDADSQGSRKSDSPRLFNLADLIDIESPSELREIDDILPPTPSTIEYSPSPDYSPAVSPRPEIQDDEVGSSGITHDTIPAISCTIFDNNEL